VNRGKWKQEKHTDIFGLQSSLFFHIVSKLVQALVITYDKIFQALAVEGDVLLQKPDGNRLLRRCFFSFPNT
jgi:hypothetical protein